MYCFNILFLLTLLLLYMLLFIPMKLLRYTGHVKIPWISWIFSVSGPLTGTSRTNFSSNINLPSPGTPAGDHQLIYIFFLLSLHHFTSLKFCRRPQQFTFFCRWVKQKQSKTMLVNHWKMMKSKELKLIKKTQANCISATFVETLSCMKKVYLTMFQIITKIAPSVTFSSMILIH